jgi:HlyD family secretion protein
MKPLPKRGVQALGGLLALLGVIWLLRPRPVLVEVAPVTRGPLRVTVDEEGQTRVRDRYLVTAPVAGRVSRMTLREGDSVARGAIVAVMYPAPLDARSREGAMARLAQAQDAARSAAAATAQAQSALEQSRRDRSRAEQLAARGVIAPVERERAELDLAVREREFEAADFRAQAAAHDVETARAALLEGGARPLPLRSAVAGRVLRVPEPSERVVTAGTPLLELGNPARLEFVSDLLSTAAVTVRCGDPVLIEGWGGGTLRGSLRLVEPSGFTKVSALGVEEQRVNVVGDFLDPPAELGDRFRIEIRIVVWENDSVLQVPGNAVFRRGDGWAVFVLDGGRARLRTVLVGHRTPFAVEIVKGLAAGDRTIGNPTDRIADGVRVRSADR